jgi:putative SOS response-associated peptidase YedK
MCGRARLPDDVSEIKQDLRIEWDRLGDYQPRWNAPPTTPMPVVTFADGKRCLETMRWGLIPSWAKDMKLGHPTFNARADAVDKTPMFRGAWRAGRRCLVIADAYYEWRARDKQPFAIALGNRGPMTFAGLWDTWRRPDDGALTKSFTIITTEANELIAPVHHRMPVILSPEAWPAWLGETAATPQALKALLVPYPSAQMTYWPVDRKVGNVKNDSPDLLEPLQGVA